jgi:hypothetical protein
MVKRARMHQIALAVAGGLAALPIAAWAVSSGYYSPAMQDCSASADEYDVQGAQPGCHNAALVVSDGSGHRYVDAGTYQTAQDQPVDSAGAAVDPTGGNPASGAQVYFGADDNLDFGEHDGATDWHSGPSDGGALSAGANPSSADPWLTALASFDLAYLLTHPAPAGYAGAGACADGTCFSAQSQQTAVFQGGNPSKHRDAYDYSGTNWDPYGCSSQDASSDSRQACGGHTLEWWNQRQGTTYAEPGVQVYEDPDAQSSPALGPQLYPAPAAYAGTCGVTAGGGPVQAPSSPLTNSAGQVQIKTAC